MRRASLLALLLAIPVGVSAFENFPPPEFSQPYEFPQVSRPGPRAQVFSYIDIGVLVAALALAAYLALRRRSRRELFALTVFSLLYFGFYRGGCVCAVGAIQNVALALCRPEYPLPATVAAFFLIPLVFALFFGRVFCAAVCPLGAAQEVVLLRPIKLPSWVDSSLGLIPYIYLGASVLFAATGSAFIICRYDPFVLFFRLGGSMGMLAFGAAILLASTVIGRPYCRYLCPYGVLLRLVSPLAKWRVRVSPAECVNCHLCADACPYGALQAPTPEAGMVKRTEGKTRLAVLLALLPVLVVGGAGLGRLSRPVLAQMNSTVRLADQVWLEEHGRVEEQTEASEAFDTLGLESMDLYREAADIVGAFDVGSMILGAWIGLVIGLRMIALSVRRHREEYQADPAACVACGRCYSSCPIERARGAQIEEGL